MNKKLIALAGLVILVGGLLAGGYYWWRPRVANQAIIEAADAFQAGKDNNDAVQYENALKFLDKAIDWGRYDSTIGLFRGQIFAALGRIDEAKEQYEKVRTADPSAKQAVEDLMGQLPQ